ncbi:DUF6240 domain-containing protein [Butyrivibrio sp. AE2032]|uniref:DUF6240 domain-containing protein n=1 Tax=Butyrivibrio sp. AE2032 TaxID=1458463 RepID=UPI00054FF29F|nr:DUF6240 domain-containing protein [Butyrivibrio sp. AE2032]
MNISFQTITGHKTSQDSILSGMEAEGRIVSGPSKKDQLEKPSYAMSLDGSGFTDNVYAEHSRNKDDVAAMAEGTDVNLQHNFMALLSNTMSGEDYAKALEDGFDIKNMNCEETVSIVDKIKSVLLEAGVEITGFNDDLSLDKLRKITGSDSFATALQKSFKENDIPLTTENVKSAKAAVEQVEDIESLEDGAVKFMVQNDMEPTIGNLYLAVHSTNGQNASGRGYYAQEAGGYYAQKADSYDWEQLLPQIEKVIDEAELDISDETVKDNAKWMVEQGIPLTPDKLINVNKLKSIELPAREETLVGATAAAIADGKRAVDGNLIDTTSNMHKNIEARLQLEEVRLQMTAKANLQLIGSGFSIDTAPIEELIEGLKNALSTISDEAAGDAVDEITQIPTAGAEYAMRLTMTRVSFIASGPVDVVGQMADSLDRESLYKISDASEKLTVKFKQAGEGYEKLMTAPRADLGDSIRKAFRNVDEILEDLNKELTDENRRAIRILGYNRMEVNEENFEKVRAWDVKLQSTVERLKPGAVLDLIRQGKNPLAMTIEELSENLDHDSDNDKQQSKDQEKYSRFLFKLEHKGEITQEEKTSFIGIYRLFHTLKETDYQAIGSILKTDQEMTIGNLLKATRNQKASRKGVDVKLDETFGGVDAVPSESARIDEQISASFRYYRAKAEIVYENLEPEKLVEAAPTEATLLPQLADDLQKAEKDQQLERDYIQEQIKQIRQIASLKAAEPAAEELRSVDVAVTFNNLEAMISERRDRREGNIWNRTKEIKETALLTEKLDEDDYEENYLKILGDISDKLSEELMTENDNYIDIRAISLLQKQISVMGRSAESGSFEVPVEIEGQQLSMHVTLKSDKNANSRMDASVQTYEYGLVTLSLYKDGDTLRGMLTTTNGSNQEESEYLENVRTRLCEKISERIEGIGIDRENIAILYHTQNSLSSGMVSARATDGPKPEKTETKTLLTMAKAFIEAL